MTGFQGKHQSFSSEKVCYGLDCRGGQLIRLGSHFEKTVLSGGPYLLLCCSVSRPFSVRDPFGIFTHPVTPFYSFFNTYDIITITITTKFCSRKMQ